MRTTNPAIFAAGDCADSGPNLTPVSAAEGRVAGKNLLAGKDAREIALPPIPSVVFTLPPLASVGLSVWPEDYVAMGVDFAKRGKRFDECIAIVKGLTNGGYFEFHGEFYDLPPMKLNPVPTKPIPILIGGFSEAAFKRAAEHDGFMFAGGGADSLAEMIGKINTHRKELGNDKKPFRIFATTMGEINVDAVKRNEDLGVTDMPVAFRNLYAVEADSQTLQKKIDDIKKFADEVIAKV